MSESVSSTIITTRLTPLICGVGAYSWLAYKNRPNDVAPAQFLVMEGASESRSLLGWQGIADFSGDPEKLAKALDRAGAKDLLLHYASRAYQRFGCPVWLPRVLREWKMKFPSARLTIFFHEVPGELPRFSWHFLLGKASERIVRQLAAIADVLVTNTDHHADTIRRLSGRSPIHCIPVGSNIEPIVGSSQSRANTEFVVFGLPFNRLQTLRMFGQKIREWYGSGILTKLHLIGPKDPKLEAQTAHLLGHHSGCVVSHGLLTEPDVSQLLAQARFALTSVTQENWSKSGVFMACASHGCAVVIKEKKNGIPLCYAVAEDEVGDLSPTEIEARTASLKEWYEENANWRVIARRLADLSQANGGLSDG